MIIKPEYDTAFAFDTNNSTAMVGNKNNTITLINPITGESKATIDYYFINSQNRKLKLKANQSPDSSIAFPYQQELTGNYIQESNRFKVLFNNKVYLFSKNGKQLTAGFENIYESPLEQFYVTESDIKRYKEVKRAKGLIDSTGKVIIKCENKHIHINTVDSIIYCCSAVFAVKLSDHVFDYKGNVLYTSNDHIEFSSGKLHVSKRYEPKEVYIIENSIKKSSYEIEGSSFYYLKHGKAFIIHKKDWYIIDLESLKKQKIDKEAYTQNIYSIFTF